MSQYSFTGAFNASSLIVPDAYLNIQPPNQGVIVPATTGLLALVGVASWGPVNTVTPVGSTSGLALFGNPTVRANDLVTHATAALMAQQAARSGLLSLLRVTDGTDVAASVALSNCTAAVPAAAGSGYQIADTTTLSNGTVLSVVTAKMVSQPTVTLSQSGGGSYVPNDTITLAGGTFSQAAVLTVTTTGVQSAAVAAGGSGGSNGTQTVTGTTGTGTKFTASVTVSGGAITAVLSITTAGAYTVNPTTLTAEPVTGASLTGATLNIKMGVVSATVSTPGSYTVEPTAITQASTSGAGTGATFTASPANFGVLTATVATAGLFAAPANPVSQAATSGAGTGATFTLTNATALTLTSRYTGSLANQATWAIGQGSSYTVAAPTWKLTLQVPGFPAEVYDNISGAANALYVAMASAVNNGNSPLRGPSVLMVATAGAATGAPATVSNGLLSGGTDGASSVTSSTLIGVDTTGARTGIYTFRNSGAAHLVVCDLADATQEATLSAFAQSEGILVHASGPAGETPTAAASSKQTQGTNNRWLKRWLGDWIYWLDNLNGVQRLLAPATFGAAIQSTLQPQQSALNKGVFGVVSTQRTRTGNPYANDELGILTVNSIDVITNPIPAGSMYGVRIGKTSSSDATANTDNWPVLTNFIARSMAGPGAIGSLIGQAITPQFYVTGYDMLNSYFSGLKNSGTIQAFQVQFSPANNPQSQTGIGLVVAQVWVQFFGITSIFLVNMQTGATVVVPTANANGLTTAAA